MRESVSVGTRARVCSSVSAYERACVSSCVRIWFCSYFVCSWYLFVCFALISV